MKTRILSGIVLGIVFGGILALGFWVHPLFISAAIALISALGIYELLHTAVGISHKTDVAGGMLYAFLMGLSPALKNNIGAETVSVMMALSVVYVIFAVAMVLFKHKDYDLGKMMALFGAPVLYSFGFALLEGILIHKNGIYYLLLLFNFACMCDMGAYFVGSTLGKHKLCPEISPKKTVEGAVGGLLCSLILTVVIALCFGKSLWIPLALTLPLCILGMMGDLFASAIKRTVNLKDYGNLIPGHGGILDRFDSMLMIAPLMFLFVGYGFL